jgi:hypothetical protein
MVAILDSKMADKIQDGRQEAHHEVFFCHNFGYVTDTNIIQMAIPRFLGPANQMVPSAMASHGRHIEFQDGPMRSTPKQFLAQMTFDKVS